MKKILLTLIVLLAPACASAQNFSQFFRCANVSAPCIDMDSLGSYNYGYIANISSGVWGLGYTSALDTLGTTALQFSNTGYVYVPGTMKVGGGISATTTGNVTGAASLNVLKTGDSMTGALKVSSNTTAGYSMRFIGAFLTPPASGNLEGDFGWDVTHHSIAISTATKASDASGWVYSLSSAGSVWTTY